MVRVMRIRLMTLVLLVLVAAATGYWLRPMLISPEAEPRTVTPRGNLAEDEQTAIAIFEAVSPSVVFISTTAEIVDPWTRMVFQTRKGTGSGFTWDHEGHVVTNFHVIRGASKATIRLADGRAYAAVLVGASPEHDLAVLRINVPFDPPPPIPLGESSSLKVGQKVFAIGNPFGLDHTLTTGIVSALDRSLAADGRTIDHLIQTDAAINPGNSGGPLLDSAGRLIGVNTAIYSPSGAYAGIGFAIPSDQVNAIVPELIAYGRVIRPWLGIGSDDRISAFVRKQLGLEHGLLVLKTAYGSPAAKAGLQPARLAWDGSIMPGDILLEFDGTPVNTVRELERLLSKRHIGDAVTLKVWHDGQTRELEIILGNPQMRATR